MTTTQLQSLLEFEVKEVLKKQGYKVETVFRSIHAVHDDGHFVRVSLDCSLIDSRAVSPE